MSGFPPWLRWTAVLLVAAAALAGVGAGLKATGGEFSGADGLTMQRLEELHPAYRPWFTPLWVPPSGEVESGLFALQAALGAGLLGYVLGRRRRHVA